MLPNVEVTKSDILSTYSGEHVHLKVMGGVVEHDCQPKQELPLSSLRGTDSRSLEQVANLSG